MSQTSSSPCINENGAFQTNFMETDAVHHGNHTDTDINDDIFKYFLSDELQSEEASILLSSPISESSEANLTPPQLTSSPEDSSDDFIGTSYESDSHSNLQTLLSKVKEEAENSFKTQMLNNVHSHVDMSNNDTDNEDSSPINDNQFIGKKRSAPTSPGKDNSSYILNHIDPTSSSVPLALSRDELLRLSSKGLETFAQNVAASRPLTQDEERQLKRQRRLIKNRESAQLSRLRKKVYIDELEKKVNQLTSENENLSKQMNILAFDKKKLQDEIVYLHNIIKQSPNLSSQLVNLNSHTNTYSHSQTTHNNHNPKSNSNSHPHSHSHHNSKGKTSGGSSNANAVNAKNVKAAGICLLVVLFSFGLLFNSTGSGLIESSSNSNKGKNIYAGRVLKSLKEESVDAAGSMASQSQIQLQTQKLPVSVPVLSNGNVKSQSNSNSNSINALSFVDKPKSKSGAQIEVAHSNSKKRKMKIAEEEDEENYYISSSVSTSTSSSSSASASESRSMLIDMNTRSIDSNSLNQKLILPSHHEKGEMIVRPNTAYIYCLEAHQMTQPQSSASSSSSSSSPYPENIALLIPSSVLNISTNNSEDNSNVIDTSLLEVSCQVVNLHLWPMRNATSST